MTNTKGFTPVFYQLNTIKEVNGVPFNYITNNVYANILNSVMEYGNGKAFSASYAVLAGLVGVSRRTIQTTVANLKEAGMIGVAKGQHSRLTFSIKMLPYEVPGLSKEVSEAIKQDWNDIYQ